MVGECCKKTHHECVVCSSCMSSRIKCENCIICSKCEDCKKGLCEYCKS